MHIGLIGGIGPAATIHYYQGLVDAHAAAGQALELTIVQGQARDLVENLSQGKAQRQAEIFSALVAQLKAGGAEAAAVTSMGGHFCIQELAAISPLPLIDLVPEMTAEFARRKLGRVGLMGTRNVMESGVYGAAGSTEVALPQGDDLGATHDAYIAMAQAGRVTDEQRRFFFAVADGLVRDQGAEAVVLAGTDLFLAFQGHDPGYPVIDSAQVHIDAIHRAAIQGLGGN